MKANELGILVIMFFFLSACKERSKSIAWTQEAKQDLYNHLDSISRPNMPDSAKRAKYLTYYVKRVTEEVPNGINSVSRDSLQNLNMRIGREYAFKEHITNNNTGIKPYYTPWTAAIEKGYKDAILAMGNIKGQRINDEFCNCVVNDLKKIYPDSLLVPTPQNVTNKVIIDCKKYIQLK